MRALSKIAGVLVLCALVLTTALAGTAPAKKKHTIRPLLPPIVAITSATAVTDSSARLNGTVVSSGSTNYKFEYGTTSFSQSTSTTAGLIGSLGVSKIVAGLQPSTTYIWRLIAGSTVSSTGYFTTAAAGTSGYGSGGSGGVNVLGLIDTSNPTPQAGSAIVVNPSSAIEVLLPGSTEYVSLSSTAGIPNGTTIRTGKDEVGITSVDKSGTQQTGYFWGGTFKVNQIASGLVELKLVSDFSACVTGGKKHKPRAVTASTAKSKASSNKKTGSLWGRDKGGRFRTKGRSSVATVRGTRWYTEDRCSGTFTKVTEGKVSVKPSKGKAKLISAGKSFFAKR